MISKPFSCMTSISKLSVLTLLEMPISFSRLQSSTREMGCVSSVSLRSSSYSFSSLIFCILAAMLCLLFEMGIITLIKYNTKLPIFQGFRVIISLPELGFSQTSGSSPIP